MADGVTFSTEHQPSAEARERGNEKQRANASVKQALLNAFDILGNEAFFLTLARGSGEDRRCFANIVAKLLPIEVAGAIDTNLTVKIVTQLGDEVVKVKRPPPVHLLPPANSRASIPVCEPQARAVEDPADA